MKTTQEMLEVMQHHSNGGVVEFCINPSAGWVVSKAPIWNWSEYDYRIAKPEPKKVKLLAWLTIESLIWKREGAPVPDYWKRVPSEDKEIEVEE